MKKNISILIVLITGYGFACMCPPILRLAEKQKYEIEHSECILIGEVIEVNNEDYTYKIKVVESLDGGDEIGNVYLGKNWKGCEPFIEEKGKWIIYGYIEDGYLRTIMCGLSRSLENPSLNHIPPIPDNYEKLSAKEKNELFKNFQEETKKMAKADLELEINALRKRRDESSNASK